MRLLRRLAARLWPAKHPPAKRPPAEAPAEHPAELLLRVKSPCC